MREKAILLSDVPHVDLTKVRQSKVRNRIYRVGIELEGAWRKVPLGISITRDGSLDRWEQPQDGALKGELPSEPLPVDHIETWMRKHYPHYVSAACGLHVHMSFPYALLYSRTMDPKYDKTILHYLGKWAEDHLPNHHPFWPRWRGESRYCQHVYHADGQLKKRTKDYDQHNEGHRYTVINRCYQRWSTLECRLLPMMDTADLGIAAVMEVLNITNQYLVATAGKEKRLTATIRADAVETEYNRTLIIPAGESQQRDDRSLIR